MCPEGNQFTVLRFYTSIKILAEISDVMWQVGKNIGKRELANRESLATLETPFPVSVNTEAFTGQSLSCELYTDAFRGCRKSL